MGVIDILLLVVSVLLIGIIVLQKSDEDAIFDISSADSILYLFISLSSHNIFLSSVLLSFISLESFESSESKKTFKSFLSFNDLIGL